MGEIAWGEVHSLISLRESGLKNTKTFLNPRRRVFFDLSSSEEELVSHTLESSGVFPDIQCCFDKSQVTKSDLVVISRQAVRNLGIILIYWMLT